jgi:hypothetical protein
LRESPLQIYGYRIHVHYNINNINNVNSSVTIIATTYFAATKLEYPTDHCCDIVLIFAVETCGIQNMKGRHLLRNSLWECIHSCFREIYDIPILDHVFRH